MTPQELIEKANLVRTLQDQLKILENADAYMVIKFCNGEDSKATNNQWCQLQNKRSMLL